MIKINKYHLSFSKSIGVFVSKNNIFLLCLNVDEIPNVFRLFLPYFQQIFI